MNNEEKILQMLIDMKVDMQGIKVDMQGMKTDMQGMKTELQSVKAELQGVQTDMQDMKDDIQGLKTEVHGVKTEVHGVKADMHGMQTDMHGMQTDMQSMKSEMHDVRNVQEQMVAEQVHTNKRLGSLEVDMQGLKQDVAAVQQTALRTAIIVETEVQPNIRLVAEGHGGIVDRLEKIEEQTADIDDIKDTVAVPKLISVGK